MLVLFFLQLTYFCNLGSPLTTIALILQLAEAGFYYIGSKHEPDAVQCFLCGKSLDGWEEEDDPWLEHKKHSSECKFAKLGKPECRLTVYEFFDVQMEVPLFWIKKLYENKKTELDYNRQKILKSLRKS